MHLERALYNSCEIYFIYLEENIDSKSKAVRVNLRICMDMFSESMQFVICPIGKWKVAVSR